MNNVEERLARLEEKVTMLIDSVKRIEKAIYGNSNPGSIIQRQANLEGDVHELKKLVSFLASLIVAEFGIIASILIHVWH